MEASAGVADWQFGFSARDRQFALVFFGQGCHGFTPDIGQRLGDPRQPDRVQHSVLSLLRQRVYQVVAETKVPTMRIGCVMIPSWYSWQREATIESAPSLVRGNSFSWSNRYSICSSADFLGIHPKTSNASTEQSLTPYKMQGGTDGIARALITTDQGWETIMRCLPIENIGEMAVIECAGTIVDSEAAFKLREAVNSQIDARIIVLDLSEVTAIGGGGLGMLVFLQQWTYDHNIRLKLFNPRQSVRDRLEHVSSMREFDIASLDEMIALLAREDSRYRRAAA